MIFFLYFLAMFFCALTSISIVKNSCAVFWPISAQIIYCKWWLVLLAIVAFMEAILTLFLFFRIFSHQSTTSF